MAQIPGSDSIPLAGIQLEMIRRIAGVYGHSVSDTAAEAIIAGVAASFVGRGVSQFLVGWIPGFGNAINASTAVAITEAVGWAANERFRD